MRVLSAADVALLAELPASPACDVVHLTPDGTQFAPGNEVEVTLRCDTGVQAALNVITLADAEAPSWTVAAVDGSCTPSRCVFRVPHFSFYTAIAASLTPAPATPPEGAAQPDADADEEPPTVEPITSCAEISACTADDGCCPQGCNALNDSDCAPRCGNLVVEQGETCEGASCNISCSDAPDSCSVAVLTGSPDTCDVACTTEPVTACQDDDGCCAPGCNANTDNDCSAVCGNDAVERDETCDGDSCDIACNAPDS